MSRIPGLGTIPESWSVRRGRFALQYQQRPVPGDSGIVTAFRDGEVTLRSNRRTEGFTNAIQEIGYQGVEPGDLVVHSMDGFAGAIGVAAARGKMSPVVHVYRCADGDSRFMAYVLRSLAASNYVQALAKGIRERSTSFDRSTLADLDLPFPIAAEQWRIADFLDDQVSRIDEVIALRHSQVELAAEALDAFREERLVDVDGVRRIPLQRLTDPMRPIVYGIVQAGEEVPDGVPYIKTGDMNPLRPDQLCRTSLEIDKAYRRARVRPGDIVIAMRASIGLPIVIPPELPRANLTQGTARVAPGPNVDLRWLFQVLKTRTVQGQCADRAVGTTFMTLNIWDLRRIAIPVAPEETRAKLAEEVDVEELRTTRLRHAMLAQVGLLQERKRALITAAVTGEIDVTTASGRGVA